MSVKKINNLINKHNLEKYYKIEIPIFINNIKDGKIINLKNNKIGKYDYNSRHNALYISFKDIVIKNGINYLLDSFFVYYKHQLKEFYRNGKRHGLNKFYKRTYFFWKDRVLK